MNPGNPGNFLLSLIATFSLVSLGILAPTTYASDQSLGAVSFANSGSPAAQADFLTGLAQLHNFQYPPSGRGISASSVARLKFRDGLLGRGDDL